MNYTVKFENQSSNMGSVCIYQTDASFNQDNNTMSVAWFMKRTHPQTNVNFIWQPDYSFVWSETGELKPGVIFEASQVIEADLQSLNKMTFDYNQGAFFLTNGGSNGEVGSLEISETCNIPFDRASVGIGMAGAATFVKPAQPNMNIKITPNPEYWITFGNYEKGEVLDISEITNKQKIVFAPNKYSITAILQEDNTWKIV
jgi:hypothetical protein